MNLSRDERKELDTLSSEVFGSSSKWQKLLTQGYTELVTEKKTETVPGENGEPDATREVNVPVLRADGAQQYVTKLHTLESVKTLMLDAKARIAKLREQIAAAQAAQKAKQDAEAQAKKFQQEAGGSAV